MLAGFPVCVQTFVKKSFSILLALLSVYIIWGSTYLAMRFAIHSLPPLLMAGVRYTAAGLLMYGFLRWRGLPNPTRRQWLHTGWIGVLLLCGGNGAVCLALEKGVSSSLSAMVLAITPLFAVLMARFWGQKASGREWLGIVLGVIGVAILNTGGELRATPVAGVLLILASLVWSLGSIWGRHLDLPSAFMASAVEMLAGGVVLFLCGLLRGESLAVTPTTQSLLALGYLIVFGAIVGFSAYVYLLANVRPALATSYAYVNPMVAVLLGMWLGGENMEPQEWVAMAVVLTGVVLVCLSAGGSAPVAEEGK